MSDTPETLTTWSRSSETYRIEVRRKRVKTWYVWSSTDAIAYARQTAAKLRETGRVVRIVRKTSATTFSVVH